MLRMRRPTAPRVLLPLLLPSMWLSLADGTRARRGGGGAGGGRLLLLLLMLRWHGHRHGPSRGRVYEDVVVV
jgi:hypothetical protein